MLWAIDVGNTHTVFGLHDGIAWREPWRLATEQIQTEDSLAAMLDPLCRLGGIPFKASGVVVASVVPKVNDSLQRLAKKWLDCEVQFLNHGDQVGLKVDYNPIHAVGADRIANAVAALELFKPPIIVVDFGTATTFDTIDKDGTYVGGAILPGVLTSLDGLVQRTAKLPQIALKKPEQAIGKTTVQSLESGVMFGYAGAIDALAKRIRAELGGNVKVIATGGLGDEFSTLCEEIQGYEANLTLDGLRISAKKAGWFGL